VNVLFTLHHRFHPDAGAPGATLSLGSALERLGCEVDYYGFQRAFPRSPPKEGVSRQLRFPWHVASHLHRQAHQFDVVDASTGDAWVWASLRRPGGRSTALVTRAHGLEHIAHERNLRAQSGGGPRLSRRYSLYHGGPRLWEVRGSLRLSDQCILLNPVDRDYARDRLGVPEGRLNVIPNGIADHFHAAPPPRPAEGPVRLAFIGRWTTYKGAPALVEATELLAEQGLDFSLSVLGSGVPEEDVLADFPAPVRARVSVTPEFRNAELPERLAGAEVLISPSLSEGSSASLLEAMACGLAPVATAVGAAPEIVDGTNGVLVEPGDAERAAAAVGRFGQDRGALLATRSRAQESARRFRWSEVARRTLEVYERAVAARTTAARKRGAPLRQV